MYDVFSNPLLIIDVIIAVAACVFALVILTALLREGDSGQLESLEKRIEWLLPMGFVIVIITLLNQFLGFNQAVSTIWSSGTGDPRILITGLIQAFMPLYLFLMIAMAIFFTWFIFRTIIRKKRLNVSSI